MNNKYLSILIIFCFIVSVSCICSACQQQRHTNIVIKRESKYTKLLKNQKKKISGIIDLSEDTPVSYDYSVGPQDPSGPSFNIITVDMP